MREYQKLTFFYQMLPVQCPSVSSRPEISCAGDSRHTVGRPFIEGTSVELVTGFVEV